MSTIPYSDVPVWTPHLAYAVGLIATDGNLSPDGRHISLTSCDVQQLENFKRCLGTKANISRITPGSYSKNTCYRIQVGNKALYQQLLNIGLMPNKTMSLNALEIPSLLFRDFLRGAIDGDGSIILYKDRHNVYKGTRYEYIRIYVQLPSASPSFLQWIWKSMKEGFGVRGDFSRMRPRRKGGVPLWRLRFAK